MANEKICKDCGDTFTLSYTPALCMKCDAFFECSHGHSFCVNH